MNIYLTEEKYQALKDDNQKAKLIYQTKCVIKVIESLLFKFERDLKCQNPDVKMLKSGLEYFFLTVYPSLNHSRIKIEFREMRLPDVKDLYFLSFAKRELDKVKADIKKSKDFIAIKESELPLFEKEISAEEIAKHYIKEVLKDESVKMKTSDFHPFLIFWHNGLYDYSLDVKYDLNHTTVRLQKFEILKVLFEKSQPLLSELVDKYMLINKIDYNKKNKTISYDVATNEDNKMVTITEKAYPLNRSKALKLLRYEKDSRVQNYEMDQDFRTLGYYGVFIED